MRIKTFSNLLIALPLIFLCALLPASAQAREVPVPPDKIKYPPLEFNLPQAERIALPNGMVLFYIPDHELPLVSVSIIMRAGSVYDPPGKEGLAGLTAYLLRTGGTTDINSDDLDRRLDYLAVSPSISASSDSASVYFSFLKSDMDECLSLLAEMMFKPAFEEGKVQLALSQKLEDLRRIGDNPQRLAFREFYRLLYPDDPRGRYSTPDSVKNISPTDLSAFHSAYYFPANMLVAVSGDLSREEAIDAIKKYFGNNKTALGPVAPAPTPAKLATGVFFINKTLTQATFVNGELAPDQNDSDFYAFSILDFIIGSGGFPSRIFSAVRNNEGLAYSAGSFYSASYGYGIFGTYAVTKTASTFRAVTLINDILHDAASGSITHDELQWAKNSILNAFIFSFETPHGIAVRQMAIEFEKLPADYLISYRKNIEKVTLADLKHVARKYLNKDKRLTLILGDTKKFGTMPEGWGEPVFIEKLSEDEN